MEIAIRQVWRFTSAWCGGLELDPLVVSPAGEVAPFLLGWWSAPWWLEVNACPAAAGVWDMGGIRGLPV